jgi:hypothetical protein
MASLIGSLYRLNDNRKYNIISLPATDRDIDNRLPQDLKEVTFLIPVRIDSDDRERNLNLTIDYLNHHFNATIIVCEESATAKVSYLSSKCEYLHSPTDDPHLHRTRILNDCVRLAKTKFVSIWDTDAIITVNQAIATYQALLTSRADLIYPYDGRFLEIERVFHERIVEKKYNLQNLNFKKLKLIHPNSFGGAFFCDRETFIAAGMMNETFKSYGWEDYELVVRFHRLGYKIARVNGPFIHLAHYRGVDSSLKNPYTKNNQQELEKVTAMSRSELAKYVGNFSWLPENEKTRTVSGQ